MEDNKFSIIDIVNINSENISIIKTGVKEIQAVCPSCGDTRGKFSISILKDKCNCYHCDFKGGPVALQMQLTGETDPKKAAVAVYNALKYNTSCQCQKVVNIDNEPQYIEVDKESDENISLVLRALIRYSELRKEHKEDLLKRGFSEEDIAAFGFKSIPKDTKAMCRKLMLNGFSLDGIPGFYINKRGEWDMKIPFDAEKKCQKTGYFCPVYDGQKNLLLGFQMRFDDPGDMPKYLWFSSPGKDHGSSSGSLATYLPGNNPDAVIIIEGILKATLVYCLLNKEITIVGVPGVNNYRCASHLYPNFINMLVFEAYDMDKALEPINEEIEKKTKHIAKEACNLRKYLEDEFGLLTRPLRWEYDKETGYSIGTKGLDDFLNEYKHKDIFLNYIKGIARNNAEMMRCLVKKEKLQESVC